MSYKPVHVSSCLVFAALSFVACSHPQLPTTASDPLFELQAPPLVEEVAVPSMRPAVKERYAFLLKGQVTVWVQQKYSPAIATDAKKIPPLAGVHPERKGRLGWGLMRTRDGDFYMNPTPGGTTDLREKPGRLNWITSIGLFAQRGLAGKSALFGVAKYSLKTFALGSPGDRVLNDFGGSFGTALFLGKAVFTPELLSMGTGQNEDPTNEDRTYYARKPGGFGEWTLVPTVSIRASF